MAQSPHQAVQNLIRATPAKSAKKKRQSVAFATAVDGASGTDDPLLNLSEGHRQYLRGGGHHRGSSPQVRRGEGRGTRRGARRHASVRDVELRQGRHRGGRRRGRVNTSRENARTSSPGRRPRSQAHGADVAAAAAAQREAPRPPRRRSLPGDGG